MPFIYKMNGKEIPTTLSSNPPSLILLWPLAMNQSLARDTWPPLLLCKLQSFLRMIPSAYARTILLITAPFLRGDVMYACTCLFQPSVQEHIVSPFLINSSLFTLLRMKYPYPCNLVVLTLSSEFLPS